MEDFQSSQINAFYLEYKSYLLSLAYQMMGSVSDAEDVLQEVYLKIQQVHPSQIRQKKSFLTKVTIHQCLDHLKEAYRQREVYVGSWLPEPLLTDETSKSPEQIALQEEAVSFALLTMLERLNPVERAVFLLREVFGFPYAEIAEMVGKTEVNCRKIHSRGKAKISQKKLFHPSQDSDRLVHQLIEAMHTGNIDSLVQQIAEDAIAFTDGGGKVRVAVQPIRTRKRILLYLLGMLRKVPQILGGEKLMFRQVQVNGDTGIAIVNRNQLLALLMLQVADQKIHRLYVVVNPEKLAPAA